MIRPLLIVLWLAPFMLLSQELPLVHFTTDKEINPLPGTAVTAVFQDGEGFIWVSVYGSGLVRYDGQKMETFGHEEGVSPYVFSITQDLTGRLWIGEQQMGIIASAKPLHEYNPGEKISFVNNLHNLSLTGIKISGRNQLLADRHGNIWSSTMKHILRYHYSADDSLAVDTLTVPDHPEIRNFLFSFVEKRNGDLAAISLSEYLVTISAFDYSVNTTHIPLQTEMAATQKHGIHLMEAADGYLWSVSNNGLVCSLGKDGESLPRKIKVDPVPHRYGDKHVKMCLELEKYPK